MKASKVFITIEQDNVAKKLDYPKNMPLPRVGETVFYETSRGKVVGTVYDVRHTVTGSIADINIKVKDY
jgi:hypothetical protein